MTDINILNLIGESVYQSYFQIKKQESVLIVTDPGKLKEAELLYESAKTYTSKVTKLILEGMTENAQEPPENIQQAMLSHDIAVLVTTYSLSHTKARKEASQKGTRIASLPGITIEMMRRTFVVDTRQIVHRSEHIANVLSASSQATIFTDSGTEFSFSIDKRTAIADTGLLHTKGAFGNLPAGEAFIAPVEGTANGVVVVDGCIAEIELDKPITIQIKNGIVTSISGQQAARDLEQAMKTAGDKARVVAELGIGTNPNAMISSKVLEAEKVLGTVHIAFGNNAGFGGVNDVPFHTDVVMLKPTVLCDTTTVLDKGNLIEF